MGYTKVTTDKGVFTWTTQRYHVGTYVVLSHNDVRMEQSGTHRSELAVHTDIRKRADKLGDKWEGSDILEMTPGEPKRAFKEPITINNGAGKLVNTFGRKLFEWEGLEFYLTLTVDDVLEFLKLFTITEKSSGMSIVTHMPDEDIAQAIGLERLKEHGVDYVKEQVAKHKLPDNDTQTIKED